MAVPTSGEATLSFSFYVRKYLLPSVKVGSKTNILGSKIGGHITAHLTSVQELSDLRPNRITYGQRH